MEDNKKRLSGFMAKGLHCSQAMLLAINEMREIANPDLVRAAGGLGAGMFRQENCGALTGGACILGLFGARSTPGDEPAFDYREAVNELLEWFEARFGSIECRDLAQEDAAEQFEACTDIVAITFQKCLEILEANGVDIYD